MKFHKQIKLEGHTQSEIQDTLESNGLKFRRMRQENTFQEKLELTNGFNKIQFVIEDGLLEVRGNGDIEVWEWSLRVPSYFNSDVSESRYTKSDIGYERDGWSYEKSTGEKINVVKSSDEIQ